MRCLLPSALVFEVGRRRRRRDGRPRAGPAPRPGRPAWCAAGAPGVCAHAGGVPGVAPSAGASAPRPDRRHRWRLRIAVALRGALRGRHRARAPCRDACAREAGRAERRARDAARAARLVGRTDPAGEGGRGLEAAAGGAAAEPRGTGRQHAAGHGGAAERGRGGDGGAGAELRRAGDEPGGERRARTWRDRTRRWRPEWSRPPASA